MRGRIVTTLIHSKIQLSIFAVVILMFALFILFNPGTFLSYRIYYAFMSTIPFTAILAISITLVIILGEIDLSFPSVIGISAFTYASVFTHSGNVYLAFICSLLIGAFAGLVNGLFIVKVRIPSLIITLGMGFFWRGLVYVLSGGKGLSLVETQGSVLYKILVGRIGGVVPAQAIWLAGVAILFGALLRCHKFGTHILFTGDYSESARMMGINVNRVRIIVFVQLGIFAALVSMISSSEIVYVYPTTGDGYFLGVLAAVFLGGTSVFGGKGTIFGTLMGAIIIGSLEAGILSSGVSGFWVQLVYGVVIVMSLNLYAYLSRIGRYRS
jgi:simple sugar transport system permease protein